MECGGLTPLWIPPRSTGAQAQVIGDAGFNVVMVGMNPNSDDTRTGVVDPAEGKCDHPIRRQAREGALNAP